MNEKIQELQKQLEKLNQYDKSVEIYDLQERIHNTKERIEEGKRYMNRYYKELKNHMIKLKALQESEDKISDFSSEIEAILGHKYVENMIVESNKVYNIYTDYIDIYDEEGNRFRGNKYRLRFDYNKMECRIYGIDEDLCRKSYWSEKDPHPHVDGDIGKACWGDAGSMLSINMNEYELFASYITVLNFLQQVNTNDPAGEYICNWDCIDDEDNDLDNPYEQKNECTCYECGYGMIAEESYYCEECGNTCCELHSVWIEDEGRYICSDCVDREYVYCNHCDKLVRKDDTIEVDGMFYCKDCVDYNFVVCDNCREYFEEEKTFTCEQCGRNFCSDCDEEHDGLCEECYEELMEREGEEDKEDEC